MTQLKDQGSNGTRRRRLKNERGLPDASARQDLAKTYLETQGRLFPELAKQGVLPRANQKNIARLADEFERAFLSGMIAEISGKESNLPMSLAAAYLRYSDDNSNPRSLDQQLRKALERAAQDGAFIPWAFVCADAAITGTTANRRGYQMAKGLIQREDCGIERIYIDEIGRASRDAIEALTLGRLIESCKKRLIGVSDSFDSDNPQSKLMLGIFAMLHEWFVDQLRSKVNRGMDDAFARGANIYDAAIGYRLEQAIDQNGNPIFDPADGSPVYTKVTDDEGAKWVLEAFELYALKKWSRGRIGRLFNRHKVGGKQTWDGSRIRQLLTRETYNGRECYRMTYRAIDPQSGKLKTYKRPQKEWHTRAVPHLKVISDELWEKTQERLKVCAEAFTANGKKKGRRSEVYPTTLFRPICGDCRSSLTLSRSGKYASFCCLNGIDGKHGCTLRTNKSLNLVAQPILKHLQDEVFTEAFLEAVVREANAALETMAAEPTEDLEPILLAIKKEKKKLDRLRRIVIEVEDEASLPSIARDILACETQLAELHEAKADAEARNAPPPAPLTKEDIPALLKDLHGLLSEEVQIAAPLLAELTGPIVVYEAEEKSKRGKAWVAHFTVNTVPVMAKLATSRDCPSSSALAYLTTRGWKMPREVVVQLRKTPKYEQTSQEAAEMADRGTSIATIAAALTTSWETVKNALEFAQKGKRPGTKPTGKKIRKRNGPPKYLAIKDEVVRRHKIKKQTMDRIARELGVCEGTVRRAWDSAHPSEVRTAAKLGKTPNRGPWRHLSSAKIRRMRELLGRGERVAVIAKKVGVSGNTVRRERLRLLEPVK